MQAYPKAHLIAAFTVAIILSVTWISLPETASPLAAAENLDHPGGPDEVPAQPVTLPDPGETSTVDTLDAHALTDLTANTLSPANDPPLNIHGPWEQMTVKSGDSLSTLFRRHKLSPSDLDTIIKLGPETNSLKKIFPGQSLGFRKAATAELEALKYEISPLQTLYVYRTEDGFTANTRVITPQVITAFKTGQITEDNPSLYEAGLAAGLSENIIMKLSYIFQWDISFALDIRQGDAFTLMYEEIYADGEKIRDGDILAALFVNQGDTSTAVMYENEAGRRDYYTPEGKSMRKAFIRDPVHFSHISSRFNPRRLHPVHKTVRPHRGIDYAARSGTPIVAAGDGKVTTARQNQSSGKYVVIQHGQQYTTKYLHMSNFANGIRSGKSVRQGQVIGYVGSTGWATGPHLHYEFLVNGVHRNPRSVKLPNASPIKSQDRERFKITALPTLARLYSLAGVENYAAIKPSEDKGAI